MKKIKFLILFFIFLILAKFFVGQALAIERINEFSNEIYVNKDGTITIKEKIIYDFGSQLRHGIYREIPFVKKNQEGKKFALDFFDFQVVDENGLPYLFNKKQEGEKIRLKIGDPNKKITGLHTYIISYKIAGALTYFSNHDELYWNITGNHWDVSIDFAKAKIFLPTSNASNLKYDCFTGGYGSKEKYCHVKILSEGKQKIIVIETKGFLNPKQGLTIVVGFPKNLVKVLEPKEYKNFWDTFIGKIIFLFFLFLIFCWYFVLPIYIVFYWFKYGRDPKVKNFGEVSAWFDPPKTPDGKRFLTPAEVGVLGDEKVDLKDICATLVDLACRGYLIIDERKPKEFWLLKSKKKEINLLPFEEKLLNNFFNKSREINLEKRNLYDEVEQVKVAIYEEVVKVGLFPKNPQRIRNEMLGLGILGFITGNVFLITSLLIFGQHLPKKTIEGVKAKNIAFSLRNFLRSQERQLKFQGDKQMFFEKLLPYAIVFGVEKIWVERFKNLDIKPPSWYHSSSTNFNLVSFSNNLNSSLSSFTSSASISSSGFSSGFSGGFSGGGGGGGGGRSW